MATKQSKLTPYEDELVKATNKVKEYKVICEANIVSLFYKNSDLLYLYPNLKISDIGNNMWKIYFQIASDIILKEGKTLDEITIAFYLSKHPKLRDKYEEYGGFEKISSTGIYIKGENLDGYMKELQKWNTVIKMLSKKFPVYDRISDFADMSLEDIYDEYSASLNHLFANAEGDIKSHCLTEGIDELIEKLNEGAMVGLPYADMSMLNKETGGRLKGHMDMVSAVSNLGKSTIVRNLCIPSAIIHKEPLCIILNEENLSKVQTESLILVCNVIFKRDVAKYVLRDGHFTSETRAMLSEASEWLKKQCDGGLIRVIPFQRYSVELAIKTISKYAHLGYQYFIIDTLKLGYDSRGDQAWLELMQDSVKLYDLIKPTGLNVHLLVTYQLGKSSVKTRFLTQDSLGVSKGIYDVMSTVTLWRALNQDEYDGEKKALMCYRLDGKNGKTQIPVKLTKDKNYQICFIGKNRSGGTNYQIICEHNLGKNILKEVGMCVVPQDF